MEHEALVTLSAEQRPLSGGFQAQFQEPPTVCLLGSLHNVFVYSGPGCEALLLSPVPVAPSPPLSPLHFGNSVSEVLVT